MKTEVVKKKKVLNGVVVSNKMDKTAVVSVSNFNKHPKYQKYIKVSKKYKAHDEDNSAVVGQNVMIEECSPISKDKHFKIIK
ncbi:MAG: 30S ribosomal protein S17 [Candidatus Pacebacteria bacterium]|nr:30S ribosomal protein S17 [Candidatus Paceibacterota bacterium]MBP9772661.1 30S ribosomal protein S17 [Candidatus Paceibacterota bacterium]QQR76270.1 MAG: 30S ribosomal protein S17 [Candidatus Nomurabacteria bacterium]